MSHHASPRRTARWSPTPITQAYLGAQAFTNNTAELTALGETLRNLIALAETLPSGRSIIRPDQAKSQLPVRDWYRYYHTGRALNKELSQPQSTASITYFPQNAPSRGDTCVDTAITNGTTMLTASPILAAREP